MKIKEITFIRRAYDSRPCGIEKYPTWCIFTEIGLYNFIENTVMDDYSYTGQFCFIQNAQIGKFSNIAAMVRIGPTDHPYERPSFIILPIVKKCMALVNKMMKHFLNNVKVKSAQLAMIHGLVTGLLFSQA